MIILFYSTSDIRWLFHFVEDVGWNSQGGPRERPGVLDPRYFHPD